MLAEAEVKHFDGAKFASVEDIQMGGDGEEISEDSELFLFLG
jgi:hypothetical protein